MQEWPLETHAPVASVFWTERWEGGKVISASCVFWFHTWRVVAAAASMPHRSHQQHIIAASLAQAGSASQEAGSGLRSLGLMALLKRSTSKESLNGVGGVLDERLDE